MRKIVIHRRGGYERLRCEDHPDPVAGRGEVALRVEAIGVNYADCIVRMGLYRSAKAYVGWPITPGFEVSGTVIARGEGAQNFALGQRVIAVTRFGGYATRLVVPERQVFPVPSGWSLAQAAAFPTAHLTAYFAMMELARPRAGAHVLVHSAAGGVGSALIRIARHRGCHVVGVVGAHHKCEVALQTGAHAVVDRSAGAWWKGAQLHAPAGYDAVFDALGVQTLRRSYRLVTPTGRLIVYGFASMLPRHGKPLRWFRLLWDWLRTPRFNPMDLTSRNRSVMGFNLSYLFDRHRLLDEGMTQLLAWAETDVLPPPAVQIYPLGEVARAHQALESGQTVGKLVLVPEEVGGGDA